MSQARTAAARTPYASVAGRGHSGELRQARLRRARLRALLEDPADRPAAARRAAREYRTRTRRAEPTAVHRTAVSVQPTARAHAVASVPVEVRPVPQPVPGGRSAPVLSPRFAPRPRGDLLDHMLRRRVWIGVLGLLLGGIVLLNVSSLQQSGEINAMSQQETQLKAQNAQLGGAAAGLSSSERIQHDAEALGYVMPPPGSVHYIQTNPADDAHKAGAQLSQPASAPPAQSGGPGPARTAAGRAASASSHR